MAQSKYSTNEIIEILRKEIEHMNNCENQKYTTERELKERFSISRMTARLVLNNLVAEGLLYRNKGRGVFINKRIIQRSQYIYSFTELMKERGLEPSSKLIEIKKVLPPEMARLNLGLNEGEFCYFIKRLRFADHEPFAYETIYTPIDLVPNLETYDLENDSYYRILEEEAHREFSYDKEIISAEIVEGEIAQSLYNKNQAVVLKVLDILYDTNHQVLEYAESWYHAEKYSYVSISIKR